MNIQLGDLNLDERNILIYTALISSIGVLLSNLEWLQLSDHFRKEGLYSWQVRKVRTQQLVHKYLLRVLNLIFEYPQIIYYLVFRIVLVVMLFLATNNQILFSILCLTIVASSIILSIRGNEGTTGADQMNTITLLAVGLGLFSTSILVHKVVILFLTGQLILAYSTSGWIRILQPTWRTGEDLLVVLRQHTYGNKAIWKFGIRNKGFVRIVSLTILLFECLSSVAIFLPKEFVLVYLVIGVLFHVSNAVIMGLNIFVWSFLPLYSCFYYSSQLIRDTLF